MASGVVLTYVSSRSVGSNEPLDAGDGFAVKADAGGNSGTDRGSKAGRESRRGNFTVVVGRNLIPSWTV